jgi:hypothetical protein
VDPARSENHGMDGTSLRENREIPRSPAQLITGRAVGGTRRGRSEMHECGKSDRPVVPANLPKEAAAWGGREGKGASHGEHGRHNASRTQRRAGCVECAGSCA